MTYEFNVRADSSVPLPEESAAIPNNSQPLTPEEKRDIKRAISALQAAANGDFNTALSQIHEIRTSTMRKEIQALIEMAQKYGPLETAADSLISSLRTAQSSDDKQKIEINEPMREFIKLAREGNPPQSDSTENALNKLEKGEKLSGAEASDLLAYLEESKEKVIPQGKRAATLTQQIKGLQDRYEQENSDAGSRTRALV